MKYVKLFEKFNEKNSFIVYRGEQKDSAGMYYTDSKQVAKYFNDKFLKFELTFENPFVVECPDGSSVHFSDVRPRLKKVLSTIQMKSLMNFDKKLKEKNKPKIYSYSKTGAKKFVGYGKPGDEIPVDTFGKWVESLGKYDGVIFKNIEEADDMSIESTTYIAFNPKKQTKITK